MLKNVGVKENCICVKYHCTVLLNGQMYIEIGL